MVVEVVVEVHVAHKRVSCLEFQNLLELVMVSILVGEEEVVEYTLVVEEVDL